jgi:hypothetical protein
MDFALIHIQNLNVGSPLVPFLWDGLGQELKLVPKGFFRYLHSTQGCTRAGWHLGVGQAFDPAVLPAFQPAGDSCACQP